MPTMSKVEIYIYLFLSLVGTTLAGMQQFDWTTFFEPKTALGIVGLINLLGVVVRGWISTVEMVAKRIATPPVA